MTDLEELRKKLEDNLFFSQIGFEVIDFEEDNVLIKLPFNKNVLNLNETIHGGVHATMIDWVFGMMIRLKTKERCATINLNMNYLRSASSGDIYGNGKIVQLGYRLITIEGQVFDEKENVLAKGIGTFKVIRSK